MGKISSAGVLRLRATSVVSRDRDVRRFAQDDGFCGELEIEQTSLFSNFCIEKLPAAFIG
jgi:hypothetical protein